MSELFKAVGITSAKKPKKYRELCSTDLNLLYFVSQNCINSSHVGFPSNGIQWNEFCRVYREHARNAQIHLPRLSEWNVIRKSRMYDISTNLRDARKWWDVSRMSCISHQGLKPPTDVCKSACITLLVCPDKDVPLVVQRLRVIEVVQGLLKGHPSDYARGAYVCKRCHRYSIPMCFTRSHNKCVNEACRHAKVVAKEASMAKKRKMEKALDYMQTRIFSKPCSKCQCSIKCRSNELKPRVNTHTNALMVKLCYRHRFIDTKQQWLLKLPTTGVSYMYETHACMHAPHCLSNCIRVLTVEDEEAVVVCRACKELQKHKCLHCKCYFDGIGRGLCNKCMNHLDTPSTHRITPQRDSKRLSTCNVCAFKKRKARAITDATRRVQFKTTHGTMWEDVRADVRSRIEMQFRLHRAWFRRRQPNRVEAKISFRKIEYEIGWVDADDGDLHTHYQNWLKRFRRNIARKWISLVSCYMRNKDLNTELLRYWK